MRSSIVLLLLIAACERGHYATRDHSSESETTTGSEASEASAADTTPTAAESTTTSSESTASEEATSEADAEAAQIAEVEAVEPAQRGHAPEEHMARARQEAASNVTITVRTTSGPVTVGVARQALSVQRARVDHCYRTVLGPDAVGSIRASLHVEASGAVRCELETMVPELDRALPCIDAALERTPFPASADGRPTHVVAEVSRSAAPR